MPWWRKKAEPSTKVKLEESPKLTKVTATEAEDEPPLRAQLIEARARVKREIEILQSPSGIGQAPDSSEDMAVLVAELREIEDALANLGPDRA